MRRSRRPFTVRQDARGLWEADFRPSGFAQHVPLGLPRGAEAWEAGAAAAERLRLLRSGGIDGRGQTSLPLAPDDRHVGALCEAWLAGRTFATSGTRRHYTETVAALVRDLATLTVGALAPPHGDALLLALRDRWAAAGLSAKTRGNRLAVLRRALDHARVPALPRFPTAYREDERLYIPRDRWEPEHRIVKLFAEVERGLCQYIRWRGRAVPGVYGPGPAADPSHPEVRRRMLYLHLAYWLGWSKGDVERATPARLDWRTGVYLLGRHKAQRPDPRKDGIPEGIEPWQPIPAPLLVLLRREADARGDFAEGVPVVGPWRHPARALGEACKRLGWRPMTLHDLRHSAAVRWAEAGCSLLVISALLGHTDSHMAKRVYIHVSRALRMRALAGAPNATELRSRRTRKAVPAVRPGRFRPTVSLPERGKEHEPST